MINFVYVKPFSSVSYSHECRVKRLREWDHNFTYMLMMMLNVDIQATKAREIEVYGYSYHDLNYFLRMAGKGAIEY